MNALPSQKIHYHQGVYTFDVMVAMAIISVMAVTPLVLGILANLNLQGIIDCKLAISWRWSIVLIVMGGCLLVFLKCILCATCIDHHTVKFSEQDSKWTPKKSLPNSYTFLGNSVAVTQNGFQETHLFPNKKAAESYIDKNLLEKNFCKHPKLAAETGATIHKHAADLILDTFIDQILDVEPWNRSFQELPPEEHAYAYHAHDMKPHQDVTIYSVLIHPRGERAIHFFMNHTQAVAFIRALPTHF